MNDMRTVDSLAIEYFAALEAGTAPDLEQLAARLPDEASRAELRELVALGRWARKQFPEALRAETVLAGRYEMMAELGRGGYGRVWKARDIRLDRVVAIKVFHPLVDPARLKEDLHRERTSLARVSHPAIVQCYDSGESEDYQFLTMEFIEGLSLDSLLAKLAKACPQRWPDRVLVEYLVGAGGAGALIQDDWFRTVASVMVELLSALALTHGAGVVHRDLKPQNVMLRPGARPVLLDFGLAGLAQQDTGSLTRNLTGTHSYFAPEQLKDFRTKKDVRIDVYQCGLILYEMLALRAAFPVDLGADLLSHVRAGVRRWPSAVRPGVPATLEDICMKALEVRPERRYATAQAFLADLETYLDGGVPLASRLGVAGRVLVKTRQQLRRHRTLAASGAAVVLAASLTWLLQPQGSVLQQRRIAPGQYEVVAQVPIHVMGLRETVGGLWKPILVRLEASDRPDWVKKLRKGANSLYPEGGDGNGGGSATEARFIHSTTVDGEDLKGLSNLVVQATDAGTRGAASALDLETLLKMARQAQSANRGSGESSLERAVREALK